MGRKSSESAKISLRAFEVTNNELIYRKETFESKIKGVLTLDRLRITFEPVQEEDAQVYAAGYRFKLIAIRDGRYTVMYLRNQDDMTQIKSTLWSKVISTSFYEDFIVGDRIGTGGFAKVRL